MDTAIFKTLQYFSFFDYPPTFEELHTFLSVKATASEVEKSLQTLVKNAVIAIKDNRIILPEINFKNYKKRNRYSKKIVNKARSYLYILKCIPSIQFLGISGSMSMLNAEKKSDVDLFIIVEPQTVWSSRFFVLWYKKMLSLFFPDLGTMLCFNLFFSSESLIFEKNKQNEYIAHELLQLKPIINKNQIYEELIFENRWLRHFCPNVQIKSEHSIFIKEPPSQSKIVLFFELFLSKVQKWWLQRKKYKWKEERGNLWLIQEDYEYYIKSSSLV